MINDEFKEKFDFLLYFKEIKLEDNCIFSPYELENPGFYFVKQFFVLSVLSLFMILIINKYTFLFILKACFWDASLNEVLFFVFVCFSIYLIYLLFYPYLKLYSYRVIDFNKKSLYTKQCIFGRIDIYDYVKFEEILKVCNNVIPQDTLQFKYGRAKNRNLDLEHFKVNPNTLFFHQYFLSFLLKDGSLYNFVKLGYSGFEYKLTIKLAMIISEVLNIKYDICDDYCTFIVEKNCENTGCNYDLEAKKITKDDLDEDPDPSSGISMFLTYGLGIILAVVIILLLR